VKEVGRRPTINNRPIRRNADRFFHSGKNYLGSIDARGTVTDLTHAFANTPYLAATAIG
jgi:hypothetical protein